MLEVFAFGSQADLGSSHDGDGLSDRAAYIVSKFTKEAACRVDDVPRELVEHLMVVCAPFLEDGGIQDFEELITDLSKVYRRTGCLSSEHH